jgi:hypothetical protein
MRFRKRHRGLVKRRARKPCERLVGARRPGTHRASVVLADRYEPVLPLSDATATNGHIGAIDLHLTALLYISCLMLSTRISGGLQGG